MSTSMARRAIRAGAALAATLTLGFGAVACDDSAKPADTKPTPSLSAPATPSKAPEPEPTRSSPSPEPSSAAPTPSAPAPAPTPKEEAPASVSGGAGGSGGSTTGGSTTTGGSGSTGGSGESHSGASAVCNDGSASYSAHRRGTCSHHGGVAQWLKDLPS
ncbi:DUF3761 domain-containing protein [Streptomyces olivoreticuli]